MTETSEASLSNSRQAQPPTARWAMPIAASALSLLALLAAARARTWPLMHDAPVMHYVVFLMQHGRAPYRDIVDMNMPGAYMAEWAGMRLFGAGALGWWIYDTVLGAVGGAASAWIAGRGRRCAGVAAGALAYLTHQLGGPSDTGQRDWCVAVLLVAAFGCLFHAIRSRRPAWMAGFMGLCGAAASIKPPVLAIGVLFVAATCWAATCWKVRRDAADPGWPRFLLWSLLGVTVPAAAVAIFLSTWGVTGEFLETARGLVPWYGGLKRLPVMQLLRDAGFDNRRLLLIEATGLAAFLLDRSWRRWESAYLGVAALCGLAVFVAQGKGWSYHLCAQTAFVALWATLELDTTLCRGRRQHQTAAVAALALTAAMFAEGLWRQGREDFHLNDAIPSLQADLNAIGGPALSGPGLSGKVQCLDMTSAGCINVLYRMKLLPSTGFLYDFYLFPTNGNAITQTLQTRFLEQVMKNPPEVIVLSAHTWPDGYFGYDQLSHWPAFEALLAARYRLAKELTQPTRGAGYRLYLLKDSSIAAFAFASRCGASRDCCH